MAIIKTKFSRGIEGATNIVDDGTEGTKVASGTTAQRGSTTGQWRYNTETGFFEGRGASVFSTLEPTPTVTSVDVTEVDSGAGGNQTFVITGTNFSSGGTIDFVGNAGTDITASTTTFNSTTQVTAVAAKASFLNAQEPYKIKFTSGTGITGQSGSGLISVDTSPTWSTASGTVATISDTSTGTHATLLATDPDGDTVTYSETGATNITGAGLSLSSAGVISGDPTDVSASTTVSFTGRATANSKTVDRAFNIVINPTLDGTSSARANTSASAIKTLTGTTTSGIYWITINGTAREIYCDMSGFNSSGYMLMATMKDMQSGWSGSSSASTATSNINSYTNWNYDSNWWTSSTGETAISSDDYNFTLNRDYKSYLWSQYQVDNSNKDAIYLVNGDSLNTDSKRCRAGGNFSSSTLVNVFDGTTTIGTDNDNSSNTGDAWDFNGGSGTNNGFPDNNKNINGSRGNWTTGYYRIGAFGSSDTVLFGGSIASGAGIKYVHTSGTDAGGYPSNNYTQNSNYTTGISMTLWVK